MYRIERFELGAWGTNCYLLYGDGQGEATLIDAGFEPEAMLERADALGLEIGRVLLTHAHVDHIAGLSGVRKRHPDVSVYIHDAEAGFLGDAGLNLSAFLAEPIVVDPADGRLAAGESIDIAGAAWEVRHSPGHSPGGVTLYEPTQGVAIVGDTLFAGGVGRTDFPTSEPATLIRSIREQLLTLPDATRVLPGHGPETTIGRERATNPWLQS
ncbi:MAG: MBL fold metallo-hydrolase [Planctomycetota bacterium]